MTISITNAIAFIRRYLRDPDSVAWTDADIEGAIDGALESVLVEYANKGGTFLNERVSVTASAAGLADLSTYMPRKIWSVSILQDSTYRTISEVTSAARSQIENTAYTLDISMLRGYTRQGSARSIFSDGTNDRSCVAAERLVMFRAIDELLVESRVSADSLLRTISRYEAATYDTVGVSGSRSMKESRSSTPYGHIGWTYEESTGGLQLWRMR